MHGNNVEVTCCHGAHWKFEEQEDLKIPGHESCGGDAEHWLLRRGSILKTSSDRQGEILAGEMCIQT